MTDRTTWTDRVKHVHQRVALILIGGMTTDAGEIRFLAQECRSLAGNLLEVADRLECRLGPIPVGAEL